VDQVNQQKVVATTTTTTLLLVTWLLAVAIHSCMYDTYVAFGVLTLLIQYQ